MNDLLPGYCASTDQYEFRLKGRLKNTRVKEDPQNMYCGGTIFVDHATSKIDVMHQVSLGASDIVRNKELYEQEAMKYGVTFKSYRGDNGVFKSQVFIDDIKKRHQLLFSLE